MGNGKGAGEERCEPTQSKDHHHTCRPNHTNHPNETFSPAGRPTLERWRAWHAMTMRIPGCCRWSRTSPTSSSVSAAGTARSAFALFSLPCCGPTLALCWPLSRVHMHVHDPSNPSIGLPAHLVHPVALIHVRPASPAAAPVLYSYGALSVRCAPSRGRTGTLRLPPLCKACLLPTFRLPEIRRRRP